MPLIRSPINSCVDRLLGPQAPSRSTLQSHPKPHPQLGASVTFTVLPYHSCINFPISQVISDLWLVWEYKSPALTFSWNKLLNVYYKVPPEIRFVWDFNLNATLAKFLPLFYPASSTFFLAPPVRFSWINHMHLDL